MAANFWNDSRLSAQRPTARVLTASAPAIPALGDGLRGRALVRRRDLSVPSWVVFCMIILATFAVCATVTMRTHAEKLTAERKFGQISTDVEKTRATNESLRREVERLRTDPRAIETAARSRMNMVRANEIVVPLE